MPSAVGYGGMNYEVSGLWSCVDAKNIDGVQLDVCDGGCGGIWFDWFELQKFDEPHEHAGELLQVSWDESVQTDHSEPFYCPAAKTP